MCSTAHQTVLPSLVCMYPTCMSDTPVSGDAVVQFTACCSVFFEFEHCIHSARIFYTGYSKAWGCLYSSISVRGTLQARRNVPTRSEERQLLMIHSPPGAPLSDTEDEPNAQISDSLLNSRIVTLVLRVYNSLPAHGKPGEQEGTVLAAVVLSKGSSCHVVSLATGSKCLNYSISADGRLAHDLHAEVLARRAACSWLYKQFLHILQCSSCNTGMQLPVLPQVYLHRCCACMLRMMRDCTGPFKFDKSRKCFYLCKGYKFHLLISHPPCGDACIMTPAGSGACAYETSAGENCRSDSQADVGRPEATIVGPGTGAKRLAPVVNPEQSTGALCTVCE